MSLRWLRDWVVKSRPFAVVGLIFLFSAISYLTKPNVALAHPDLGLHAASIVWLDDTHIRVTYDWTTSAQTQDWLPTSGGSITWNSGTSTVSTGGGSGSVIGMQWAQPIAVSSISAHGMNTSGGVTNIYTNLASDWYSNGSGWNPSPGLGTIYWGNPRIIVANGTRYDSTEGAIPGFTWEDFVFTATPTTLTTYCASLTPQSWSVSGSYNPNTDGYVGLGAYGGSSEWGTIVIEGRLGLPSYTLTYTANAHGSISGTTPQTAYQNSDGSAVTAVPDTGYHFVNWSDASTQNPRTDTNVTGNITVSANFAINTYTFAYAAGGHGSLTGSVLQTVNYGASGAAVTAVPDTGYHFVNWSDASTQNPRTDTNASGNITVTANFAATNYTFTYAAGANGTIVGTTPQTVNPGASGAAVTATANAHYHFVNWSDASTQNPRTDTNASGDITVTANFAIDTYTITYSAGANGSIIGTTPQTVSYGGNGVAVGAVAASGYSFVNWSDDSTANPRTDNNVSANISVTANFSVSNIASRGIVAPPPVYPPSIIIRTPAAGMSYNSGIIVGLDWTAENGVFTKYKVYYSRDNGVAWEAIGETTGTSLSWTVPDAGTTTGKIKVEGYDSAGVLFASAMSSGNVTLIGEAVSENSESQAAPMGTSPVIDPTVTGTYYPSAALENNPDIETDMRLSPSGIAPPCIAETLIKGSFPAVYYCGIDGKRYVFANDHVYLSWYADFSSVKEIGDDQMALIPLGGNITYRPGKRMVKIQSDPRVYVVARGGILRWVSSEAKARELFGDNWSNFIDDINDTLFVNYTIGEKI